MGKLIYQPKGKAREYAPWACNLYNGCSNMCSYCYNRHGRGKALLGKDEPTIKGGRSIKESMILFDEEINTYKDQIIADGKGLFFNFVSDPFSEETWELNFDCALDAIAFGIPVVFLSKSLPSNTFVSMFEIHKDMVKVGFTLTSCDKLEPGAIWNSQRIGVMKHLNQMGVKTWASIEPVIFITESFRMIQEAYQAGCREFKIGLLSGKKNYTPDEVETFMLTVDMTYGGDCDIYWKESVMNYIYKTK